MSIFGILAKVNRELKFYPNNKTWAEMHKFGRFLLGKFFEASKTNKKIFMELCFWKTSKEAMEVVDGYETNENASKRGKASYWSEENEETLVRLFHQFKEMQAKGEIFNMLDSLEPFFEKSGKTKRSIVKKLKELQLIKVSY